jgi:hypothetical protein
MNGHTADESLSDERILYIFSHMGPRTQDGLHRRIGDSQAILFARRILTESQLGPCSTAASGVKGLGDGAERRVEAVIEKKRAERLAEQDARNAGVRATVEDDAARYRWLRERVELDGDTYWHFPTIDRWDYQPGPQLNRQFPSVDVAIDAARGVDAPVTLSGRPAGEADEYHTANQCVDAAVLHLLGTREWPEGWQALRDHFLSLIRSARGVPPSDVRGLDGTQP